MGGGWQITLKTVRGPAWSHSLPNLLDHNLQPWGMERVTVLGYTYTESKYVKWKKNAYRKLLLVGPTPLVPGLV